MRKHPIDLVNHAFVEHRDCLVDTIRFRFRIDHGRAEDMVHSGYVGCLSAARNGQLRELISEAQAAALISIASRRKTLDWLRHCRRGYAAFTNQGEALMNGVVVRRAPLDQLVFQEQLARALATVDSLDDRDRDIVLLRLMGNHRRCEVAEKWNCCVRTVTNRARRVLERLADEIA